MPEFRDVGLPSEPVIRRVGDAFGRSVAVVLGVNRYGNGIPSLKTAVPDAEAVAALLDTAHDFTTILRRDSEVTGDTIRALFEREIGDRLGGPLGACDRLLFYFAGHGLSAPSERGPEGHLLLADSDLADRRTLFAMSELRQMIGALPCRHVLIVLDCCFAGTFRWASRQRERGLDVRAYVETLQRFVRRRAWQVLVSANHNEAAIDMAAPRRTVAPELATALRTRRIETQPHSPFAEVFLRALRGEADYTKDGLIAASEIEVFVRTTIKSGLHAEQTPQLYKLDEHDGGEFVFQVPGTELALEPAPALLLDACPYQGLRPYGVDERKRFFGRSRLIADLVKRIHAQPVTVLIGASGAGKSSALAAGVVPALREGKAWTVLELRPDTSSYDSLCDAIEKSEGAGGHTLFERITRRLSSQAEQMLCLAIDQAESLDVLVAPGERDRVLGELAQAVKAHGRRFRLVLALRSEFEPVFRNSALRTTWADAVVAMPALTQDELREVIERPARAMELAFDPPELVDTLINDVLSAPGGLALLSFALRELYVRCAGRNTDRLLTEADYADMGRLSGSLARRASELLDRLTAEDPAYEATARRVFLRMVAGRDGDWVRRRVHADELIYDDPADNRRVATLLDRFGGARLVVCEKGEWEPAHDWLVRAWPMLSMWRVQFGPASLALQLELAEAAGRWAKDGRRSSLWTDDDRLPAAREVMRGRGSWLNARERGFIVACDRRRRRRRWVLAVVAVVVAGITGAVWDAYYREDIAYYGDYVRRWGEPHGIDPLSRQEAQRRVSSVKLVRKGRRGHILHVEIVRSGAELVRENTSGLGSRPELARENANGLGSRPELALGQKTPASASAALVPCEWDFAYDASTDTVSAEIATDCTGRVIYRLQYRGGSRSRTKAEFLDENGNDAWLGGGNAERIEFVRSPPGLDVEKHYTLRHGEPASNQDGISVEKLAYDDDGHVVQTSYLDPSGQPTLNNDGYTGWRARYDRGDQVERTFHDEAGRLTLNNTGIAGWVAKFDGRGSLIGRDYLGLHGPTRSSDGYAGWRAKFDEHGNQIELRYVDENGRPTRSTGGVMGWCSTFDQHGNQIERRYIGDHDQPIRYKDGYAGWRSKFDERGNEIEGAYFDTDGMPTQSLLGHTGWRAKYDDRRNQIEMAYFDELGRPTHQRKGNAGWKATYDERGNQIELVYLDELGRPIRIDSGYAGWKVTYDERGKQVGLMYLDEAGRPTRIDSGYAGWKATYDARGKQIEVVYLDEAGKVTRGKNGYAIRRTVFDPRGRTFEQRYFDEAERPVADSDGSAGLRAEYDEWGHEVTETYLDTSGRPTLEKDGNAIVRTKFDAWGNDIEHTYLDDAGRLAKYKDGFAILRTKFDIWGHEVENAYFDEAGQPANNWDQVAVVRSVFDDHGNEIEQHSFDGSGKPTRNKDGYAILRSKFDAWGNEIEQTYFDATEAPALHRDGYYCARSKFDRWGREIEETFFDATGKPMRDKYGIAGWRSQLDARGNELERVFIDEAGKPMRNKHGVAGWRARFGVRGDALDRIYIDEAGHPARDKEGRTGPPEQPDAADDAP